MRETTEEGGNHLACSGSGWNPLIDLHFDASHAVAHVLGSGCGSGSSTARCDDPTNLSGPGGLPAPQVMSASVLNDLKIEVQGNLLREYVFSYPPPTPVIIGRIVFGVIAIGVIYLA